MKIKSYIILLALTSLLFACKKDNYDEPTSKLSGKLVYKGEAIGVETFQVPYELYQFGFGKVGPIGSSFAQDGSYSAVLFDGEYRLIIPNGQGPFIWKKTPGGSPDSMAISVKGNQVLDLDVTPYYMIKAPQIAASGGKANAAFKVEKIITDANAKNIENITLYINNTQFVSGGNNIGTATIAGSAITDPNNIVLSVTIPSITPAQNYVFARIGLKVAGVEDRIFSPLVKIQF
ncbi:MAG: DUF3823 domain-containing protein [Chitinophagaceae bacterium]|nr:DUF3823 domain-containing protein [Chitinophagaceae bacterium]